MKEEKEQTVIEKTLLYLENYREMERYINEAVSETSQVPDIGKYNISAEKAFLQSVRECRAETVILFEHLKKALASLKEDAEAAGEGYKYDALEAVYIKGMSYEDIVRETGCGRNSPKKWCRVMIQRLSIKLFGAKAIENDKNGVKTVQVGNTVKLLDMEFNEEVTYTIVGSTEVDLTQNRISNESPMGKALLGAKKNQTVEVQAPAGVIKYKILSITK